MKDYANKNEIKELDADMGFITNVVANDIINCENKMKLI